jgi:hypothetical protein
MSRPAKKMRLFLPSGYYSKARDCNQPQADPLYNFRAFSACEQSAVLDRRPTSRLDSIA